MTWSQEKHPGGLESHVCDLREEPRRLHFNVERKWQTELKIFGGLFERARDWTFKKKNSIAYLPQTQAENPVESRGIFFAV